MHLLLFDLGTDDCHVHLDLIKYQLLTKVDIIVSIHIKLFALAESFIYT